MRPLSMLISVLAVAATFTVRAQASHTASAAVPIPNTPVGKALAAWLTAFNTGDRNQVESFYRTYWPQASPSDPDIDLRLRNSTGGLDLASIKENEPRHIEFALSDRSDHRSVIAELDVTGTDPQHVTQFPIYPVGPNARVIGFQIDAPIRARVVRAVAMKLDQLYVIPDVGKKMALDITARWKHGEYDSITDGYTFARLLTTQLRAIHRDWHLQVTFSPLASPKVAADGGSARTPNASHCAFDKVERFPGNIGYLKFDGFVGSDACVRTAIDAMGFLADVGAIIFDLRDNNGGGGEVGRLLLSYLFEEPTHLMDFWDRRTGQTTPMWTRAYVPGKRLATVPVYVLTSRKTFSAAEAFTYGLQAAKRATVVGEVTGGGAHLNAFERIDDRFTISVPYGRPIDPITKTSWEGTGVIPDVKVPAAQALDVAEKLAAAELAKRRSDQVTTN
jgi:hypothetical protein